LGGVLLLVFLPIAFIEYSCRQARLEQREKEFKQDSERRKKEIMEQHRDGGGLQP
jgi:hypothetical protein